MIELRNLFICCKWQNQELLSMTHLSDSDFLFYLFVSTKQQKHRICACYVSRKKYVFVKSLINEPQI